MKGFFLAGIIFSIVAQISSASEPVLNFSGKNIISDKTENISVASSKSGAVVVFLSTGCPCSNSHIAEIKSLSTQFSNFEFVAIHSNSNEPILDAKKYFLDKGLPFPVIQDEKNKLADIFRAHKTPHAFVLNNKGEILYRGGVTNSADAPKATKFFLRNALTEINLHKSVSVAEGRTLGCTIARE